MKEMWSVGGKDIQEDCVKADQTDGYRWKRVPCSDTATYLCEPKKPPCPADYVWLPNVRTDSCFKLDDETEYKNENGQLFSSITTANKICLDDGTRLATPVTDAQKTGLSEFLSTQDQILTGDHDNDRHIDVWSGLQYFAQKKTAPATCPSCSSSPDWADVFSSPWSNTPIPKADGTALLGSVFGENKPCYTLSAHGNVFNQSQCMQQPSSNKAENQIRALCEYRVCATATGTCVFPFKLGGRLYDTCTTVGSEDGSAWCSTEVDQDGVHVEGNTMACPADCPVSNCPVGFSKHLKTCIQESASTSGDAPTTIADAETKCVEQGARLYQPRSTRTINALKAKIPVLYDSSIASNTVKTGIHAWAVQGGSTTETALGITVKTPESVPVLFYKDGSQVPRGLVSASLNWKTSYPTTGADETCVTLQDLDKISNNDCTGFSNGTLPHLSYLCEARPFTTLDGDVPNKACHFPFKLEAGGDWHHSCVYKSLPEGKSHVWCPTKVDADGVVVKGETGVCDDERNTAYDGPGALTNQLYFRFSFPLLRC